MEEIINKPDNQFKDILNDLIDYSKESEEKSALIKEVCHARRPAKPAASLNSSIYSSAASSTSSTSSASDSSTNSASSSSTSSTLSSPSQGTQSNNDAINNRNSKQRQELDDIEVAKMEDLGKTARILEHSLAISNELKTATNGVGYMVGSSTHSDKRSLSLNDKLPLPSSSSALSQIGIHHSLQHQSNLTHQNGNSNSSVTNWITVPKREKRRKRATEQPVLSEHIPGHKGEQEVDWLVNFIESGAAGTNGISGNPTKKINKNIKTQPKRQQNQNIEHEREMNSRKANNKPASTQIRPLQQQQSKPTTNSNTTSVPPTHATATTTTSTTHSNQRKVQAISIDNRPQKSLKQQSLQERPNDRVSDCKEATTSSRLKGKRNHDQKKEIGKQDEAVVTFADHIRISDDEVSGQYTFGFFEEQRQQTSNQTKSTKMTTTTTTTTTTTATTTTTTTKHNENSPNGNSKLNQIGQKHKMKHPKASLNSEQKRYKFNDNIDANSFNYHQILEFIRNSWETTKSHRL